MSDFQNITLLGSTGSIGVQTLDVVRAHPGRFRVAALTAHRRWELLARQATEFRPRVVVIGDPGCEAPLRAALAGLTASATGRPIEVRAGDEALCEVAGGEFEAAAFRGGFVAKDEGEDVLVNALVGYAGLAPTVAAIRAGKRVALANKETLVAGGACVMPLAREHGVQIVPIDSEHSAIFQCLAGESSPVRRLIVTCSGGAFLNAGLAEMERATAERALRHPKWSMGAKITIDSATLLNKGFEVIEAHWLFGVPAGRIDVLVHPQSIVHSMVEFEDGAVKAQLGSPDMHIPISYALSHPERLRGEAAAFDFVRAGALEFFEPDRARFPALGIAYDCLRRGGTAACTLNGANEAAVEAFLAGRCGFLDIVRAIEYALARAEFSLSPSLEDLGRADAEARTLAREFLGGASGRGAGTV